MRPWPIRRAPSPGLARWPARRAGRSRPSAPRWRWCAGPSPAVGPGWRPRGSAGRWAGRRRGGHDRPVPGSRRLDARIMDSWANEATSSSPANTSPRPYERPWATTGASCEISSHSSTRNGRWNQRVWEVTAVWRVRVESAWLIPSNGRKAVPMRVRSVAWASRAWWSPRSSPIGRRAHPPLDAAPGRRRGRRGRRPPAIRVSHGTMPRSVSTADSGGSTAGGASLRSRPSSSTWSDASAADTTLPS